MKEYTYTHTHTKTNTHTKIMRDGERQRVYVYMYVFLSRLAIKREKKNIHTKKPKHTDTPPAHLTPSPTAGGGRQDPRRSDGVLCGVLGALFGAARL